MKFIFVLATMLTNVTAFSKNFFPVGKQGASKAYSSKTLCEEVEGQSCFDVFGKDLRYYVVETITQDDLTRPIMKDPYNGTACDTRPACDLIIDDVVCDEGDYKETRKLKLFPGFTIVCLGIEGYEQIETSVLVLDQNLKDAIDAADTVKTNRQAQINSKVKDLYFGQKLLAIIGVQQFASGLTSSQKIQYFEDYQGLQRLLLGGAIASAKQLLEDLTPDGTLLTEVNKQELLGEINEYLAN